jgi:hypothetical protein
LLDGGEHPAAVEVHVAHQAVVDAMAATLGRDHQRERRVGVPPNRLDRIHHEDDAHASCLVLRARNRQRYRPFS